jgi:hypothetical protein
MPQRRPRRAALARAGGRTGFVAAATVLLLIAGGQAAFALPAVPAAPAKAPAAPQAPNDLDMKVSTAARHDESRKLSDIAKGMEDSEKSAEKSRSRQPNQPNQTQPATERAFRSTGRAAVNPQSASGSANVQTDFGTMSMPSVGTSFEGVGNRFGGWPPDTNGDVGKNHYVQFINIAFGIWDKSGNLLAGPLPGNAFWSGFGGPCETHNDGDPIALYDEQADRWMVSQFALNAPDGHHQCIAVSTGPDPMGSYFRYDFLYHATRLNDYPKFGIWPDAYYMTTNEFAPAFVGAGVVAFEREKILAGQQARQIYFHLGPDFGGLLPADAEGLSPPAGAPNPITMFDDDAFGTSPTDRLIQFDFHVDWANPANSTLGNNGQASRFIETAPFDSNLCNFARGCIAQQGTATRLDAISDRLMYRLAYRNFGDHQAMVVNHQVDVDGADHAGVRWYELRGGANNSWGIFQQGTFAPDAENRWMGSAALDASGNMMVGYSASSATSFPSIRLAGRLAGDPLGQLSQGETTMQAGAGAQTGANRWGDYSSLSVDPVDGCTFWYTTEYLPQTSSNQWHTRVGSVKFPGCTQGPVGTVTGVVTNAANGSPVAGAKVGTAGGSSTVTGADGRYTLVLPAGEATLTASAYGFVSQTATVTVTEGSTTTRNFALQPAPMVTVSGTIRDGSGHNWPLYARIDITGRPGGPVFTNPATGRYSFQVAANASYGFSTRALYPGYQTKTEAVDVGGSNLTHDIALPVDPACVAPGYEVHLGPTVLAENFDTPGTPAGWTVVKRNPTGAEWRFDDPRNRGNLTGGTGGFAIADSDFGGAGTTTDTDLVSPTLDFTGAPNPVLRFNSDFRDLGNEDFTDVDVSIDGGTTWTTVYHQVDSRGGPRVEEVPLTGTGGQANVKLRFHHFGTFDWWWEIDNVAVNNRSCDPVPGGLVVGFTTDSLAGTALNGVTVTSDDNPADKAVSAGTPDDPGIPDGFYWLFSHLTGAHPFTAAKAPYSSQTKTVNVAADSAVQADFALSSARITVTPTKIEAFQTLGQTRTTTVTVRNTGNAPANVEVMERAGNFTLLGRGGARLAMYRVKGGVSKAARPDGPLPPGDVGQGPVVADSWTQIRNAPVPISDNSAAFLGGKVYSAGGGIGTGNERKFMAYDTASESWGALPDLPRGRSKPELVATGEKLYLFGGWDAAGTPVAAVDVFDPVTGAWSTLPATNPKPRSAAGTAVAAGKVYLVGGCLDSVCTDATDTVVFDVAGGTFTTGTPYPHPVSWMGCGGISDKVYCAGGVGAAAFKDGHVLNPVDGTWTRIADAPIDLWGSQEAAASGLLVLAGGVTNNSTTLTNRTVAYDPASDTWQNLPNANFARARGAGACGVYKVGGWAAPFVPAPEAEKLAGLDLCQESTDVPWLAESPTQFTLAPGASQVVTVTLTATPAAGVEQPGDYTAQLAFKVNSPFPAPKVDVTMHVLPPANWGKITGKVTGLTCNNNVVPIPAQIQLNNTAAPDIATSLKANADGTYGIWLPKGRYEVIVSKDGWVAQVRRVRVQAGFVDTQDFQLRPFGGCNPRLGGV